MGSWFKPLEPLRPRSAIERLVDQATGYDPATAPKVRLLTLRCGNKKCKNEMVCAAEWYDPETAVVEVTNKCPKCDPKMLNLGDVYWLDAAGKKVYQ